MCATRGGRQLDPEEDLSCAPSAKEKCGDGYDTESQDNSRVDDRGEKDHLSALYWIGGTAGCLVLLALIGWIVVGFLNPAPSTSNGYATEAEMIAAAKHAVKESFDKSVRSSVTFVPFSAKTTYTDVRDGKKYRTIKGKVLNQNMSGAWFVNTWSVHVGSDQMGNITTGGVVVK